MPEPLSSSPPAAPVYEWRVIRLRGTPGTFVGYVNAPNQEQAIQKAAENFGIMEFGIMEEDRWQLGAYKVREMQT
jgi:1,2-phenylacetyl-CoA epoxidase PaaB subunit